MFCTNLYFTFMLPLMLGFSSCHEQAETAKEPPQIQQQARIGGRCETCEAIYVNMPQSINATDTSAAWGNAGQKLVVTGTVYKPDGKTPAPDIVVYYWQTNDKGIYEDKSSVPQQAKRHGYLRGWAKTDKKGNYTIYTIRPGSYPNSNNPQHIHMLVKEPQLPNEYYIDDVLFSDDPLLTEEIKSNRQNKGGNGMVEVNKKNGIEYVNRDIILGKNISNYPRL